VDGREVTPVERELPSLKQEARHFSGGRTSLIQQAKNTSLHLHFFSSSDNQKRK